MKNINIPEPIRFIIERLYQNGYEAYAVGGCIRDSLLGREPHDWDVTTSASPEEVKQIFKRTFDTGIEHGTVTILQGSEAVEVTTYRIDGAYEDNRHPSEVSFTKDLKEDLKRRDFTINAIAYNDHDGIVDPFNGTEDLKNGLIRCVGDPEERFTEDALRIMRAIRFSAQLGFEIQERTQNSIRNHAPNLQSISAERIAAELIKLITSDSPEKIQTAYELGITGVILPEFDVMMKTPQNSPHHCCGVGEHTIRSMMHCPPEKDIRLTMLLHDIGKPLVRTTDPDGTDHFRMHSVESVRISQEILRRLKLDNDTIRKVSILVRYHDWHPTPNEANVRLLVHSVGKDLFPELMKVQKADIAAQSPYMREEKLKKIEETEEIFKCIMERGDCTDMKGLMLNGNDLLKLGFKKGPMIGEILNEALTMVLEDHKKNNREILLRFAKRKIND